MTKWRWLILGIAGVLAVTAAVALLSGTGSKKTYQDPSGSMEPTIKPGQKISVDQSAYDASDPKIDDIVLFYGPKGATGKGPECGDPNTGAGGKSGSPCAAPTPARTDVKYVKRIVAGPGDTLSIHDGHPVVNGVEAHEDFAAPCRPGNSQCNLPGKITIPPNHWFVLGDNRAYSDDSRYYGPIPTDWIVGRVED